MFFAYNKIEYTDNKINPAKWPSISKGISETGQLPVLEIDDLKLVGYWSILRYLAQSKGVMYPKDPYQVYLVESLHGFIADIQNQIMKNISAGDLEAATNWISQNMVPMFVLIERRLEQNNSGEGWFVGNEPTIVDIDVFSLIYDKFLRPAKREHGKEYFVLTPKLLAWAERFENSLPEFKEYIENRDDSKRF